MSQRDGWKFCPHDLFALMNKESVTIEDVAAAIAAVMDNNSDPDGQWRGADICAELAEFVRINHGWKDCPDHGSYSISHATCPICLEEATR